MYETLLALGLAETCSVKFTGMDDSRDRLTIKIVDIPLRPALVLLKITHGTEFADLYMWSPDPVAG